MNDTSPAAREVYFKRMREMTPSERIDLAAGLCEAGHALERAAMRRRYPAAGEEEITFRIAVARFGQELACKAYGRT